MVTFVFYGVASIACFMFIVIFLTLGTPFPRESKID